MKMNDIKIRLDMQAYYDQLVLYRKTITAQIEVLEADVLICTHQKTIERAGGTIFCMNPNCGKLIDGGINNETQV